MKSVSQAPLNQQQQYENSHLTTISCKTNNQKGISLTLYVMGFPFCSRPWRIRNPKFLSSEWYPNPDPASKSWMKSAFPGKMQTSLHYSLLMLLALNLPLCLYCHLIETTQLAKNSGEGAERHLHLLNGGLHLDSTRDAHHTLLLSLSLPMLWTPQAMLMGFKNHF